ncbi:MAG: copper resistance protein NlpE [Zoogloeaceae bacterium]|jgi:hypothetical protein|nr:copper resistance protein NlpE [Zoogloeaceae bacterium]
MISRLRLFQPEIVHIPATRNSTLETSMYNKKKMFCPSPFPFLLAAAASLAACDATPPSARPESAPAGETTSAEPPPISGVFQGVLPCADCEGIRTTLTLSGDGAFVLESSYLKNGEQPAPTQTGTWKRTGTVIELFPSRTDPATASDRLCFDMTDAGTLTPFDISCAPITTFSTPPVLKRTP